MGQWFGDSGNDNDNKNNEKQTSGETSTCPSQGGRRVPPPLDTGTQEITIARLLEPNQKLNPSPAQVYELFRDHGFKIMLVDMKGTAMMTEKQRQGTIREINGNGGHNFIVHIICDQLPDAIHTCKGLLDANVNTNTNAAKSALIQKQQNPSLSLHYDFLAVEACQKGLFNSNIVDRRTAKFAIQNYQEQVSGLSSNEFPLVCPEDEFFRELLKQSLDQERRLRSYYHSTINNKNSSSRSIGSDNDSNYKEYWGPDEESRHKAMFWKAARDDKNLAP